MAQALNKWVERYDARGVVQAVPFSQESFRHQMQIAERHNQCQPRVGQAPGRQFVRTVERETIKPVNVLEARYIGALCVVLIKDEGTWIVEVRNVQEQGRVVSREKFTSPRAAAKAFRAEIGA